MNATQDSFTRAYLEAVLFTDAGPDGEIPAGSEFSPEALQMVAEDCAKFRAQAGELIPNGCTRGSGDYTEWQQAAHDFWLTRNGHGAGFWDGDWPEVGDKLTEIAKSFGEVWAYLGDDGLIYFSR
jgi:hypothetical protein